MSRQTLLRWLPTGFMIAGAVNVLGMLLMSRGFNNPDLVAADPNVFSTFGQIMIVVWGLAYIATAKNYLSVPWLCAVFFIEKMAYVAAWAYWWINYSEQFSAIYSAAPLVGIFIAGYGINDLGFGLMFLWAFFVARTETKKT